MGVEALESDMGPMMPMGDEGFVHDSPLNGTDSRRRLEDKIEEMRLQRELREFDFDD